MKKIMKTILNCSIILMLVLGSHNQIIVNTSNNIKPCIYDVNTGKLSKDSPIPCTSKFRMIDDGPV
ncbi:hypothetical protein [Anaerorhabdus furcosa]|uniref:Secreted protein n=1 Tax=Anaerorhabdus furcosa TaxID=118967 RepID=A0A1T4K2F8_9FIRM|nr:hypothetical protein [Anaerorhabdus furcosa]SJZ36646.1 hypothetical protein SAMN02745191_0259 [Anaerorhabdus furcosa]